MWRAAWMVSEGQDALREITMAKLFCSEPTSKSPTPACRSWRRTATAWNTICSATYRDSRSSTIAAGTSEMQRNVLAGLMGLKVR